MRHLELTQVAQADLKSIKRYSSRAWGSEQTERYLADLRSTMKAIVAGAVVSRERTDLRPGLRMAVSGRHCVFFEENASRVLVVRVLHDRMDFPRHLATDENDQ